MDDTVLIHHQLQQTSGGASGIRDFGLLESAVARPKAGFGDFEAYPSLYMKAAVLGHSLIKNHAFTDANKRTAITAMFFFLALNGTTVSAERHELVTLALAFENSTFNESDVADWLEKHAK